MTEVETRTIDSIEIDNRVRQRVPFAEGDTVWVFQKKALGAWIEKPNSDTVLSGSLHSDGDTFAFSEGIRDGRISLE